MSVKNAVLITGACGYIGSNLMEALYQAGFNVIGVDRRKNHRSPEWEAIGKQRGLTNSYDFYKVDLLDREQVFKLIDQLESKRVDVMAIIHLCALADVSDSIKNPAKTIGENLLTTHNTGVLAEHLNPDKFIYMNSCMTTYYDDECWNAYAFSKRTSIQHLIRDALFSGTSCFDVILTNPVGCLKYIRTSRGLTAKITDTIVHGDILKLSVDNNKGEHDDAYKRNFISIYEVIGCMINILTRDLYSRSCCSIYCGVIDNNNNCPMYSVTQFGEYCVFDKYATIQYVKPKDFGFTDIKEATIKHVIPSDNMYLDFVNDIPQVLFDFDDDHIKIIKNIFTNKRESLAESETRFELLKQCILVNTDAKKI